MGKSCHSKQSVPFRGGIIGTARWLVPSTVRFTVRHGTAQERWQSGHGSGCLPTYFYLLT